MKELVQRVHSLCPNEYFFVGNSLFFDPVYNFSMKCISGTKEKTTFYGQNTPEQIEERRRARLQDCKDKLEKVIGPIFEYRTQIEYVGPEGFNAKFIEELYEKVTKSDWTKNETADDLENKLKEAKQEVPVKS